MTILNVPAFAETTREDSNFQTASFDDTALQSRGLICPRFTINFLTLQSEGAGNAGRRCARSRACSGSVARALVTTVTPENARHSPRNGFNGFLRALVSARSAKNHPPRDLTDWYA